VHLSRIPNTVKSGTEKKCLHAVLHGLILHPSLLLLPALALLSDKDQRGGQGLKELQWSPPASKRWYEHEGTCAFNLKRIQRVTRPDMRHMRLGQKMEVCGPV